MSEAIWEHRSLMYLGRMISGVPVVYKYLFILEDDDFIELEL